MGVRAGLGVVTVGVLAGELATAWQSPPGGVLVAAGIVALGLVHLTIRDPTRRWRYGERLAAWTKLRRPRNFANPGSFDFVAQALQELPTGLVTPRVHVTGCFLVPVPDFERGVPVNPEPSGASCS